MEIAAVRRCAMAGGVRYLDKKEAIREALLKFSRSRETLYYSELGRLVGIPAQGPWKPILDVISREETGQDRPDITFLLINKSTGLPGQIGFKPAKPPTIEQKEISRAELERIFTFYSPNKE